MGLAEDYLDLAKSLARRERRKPRQASLRRAISTAYYALFHLLTGEGSKILKVSDEARKVSRRAYEHGGMKRASERFTRRNAANSPEWAGYSKASPSSRTALAFVAEVFVLLQRARHEADYDHQRLWSRTETMTHVQRADEAFSQWKTVRESELARSYLLALLLGDRPR